MALLQYRKPVRLNPPPDDDPSLAYTPPPIIQGYDTDPGFAQDPSAPVVLSPPSEPERTLAAPIDIPRVAEQPARLREPMDESLPEGVRIPPRNGTPMSRAAGIDGWGPQGDQENPIIKLGRQVVGDIKDTAHDAGEEPAEIPYRAGVRLGKYFPRLNYREGGTDTLRDPLNVKVPPKRDTIDLPPIDGIDPAVVAKLQTVAAGGKVSPSTLLANAARKDQPVDKDGTPQPSAPSVLSPDTQPAAVESPAAKPVSTTPAVDRHNRPVLDTRIKDPLERYLDYQQRVQNWEPPKAHGWKRYVIPMLQGWAAGQRSGASPWAGMGGAITGALTGQFKPTLTNEQWKDQQLKETQAQIDQHLEQQKAITGIAHTVEETKRLKDPPARPKRIVKDKLGIYRPIDPETGRDENGNMVEGETQKSVSGFKGWVHDADGVAHFYENGQDSGRLDPGRNKVKLADGRLVDPSQSYSAELTAGREGLGDERANEAARQENARTQANIKSAQYEQTKVESALKNTAPMITRTKYNPVTAKEETYEERNPIYTDLENRRDHLIDNIRTLNGQIKPIVAPRTNSASPGFATPPVAVYTEQQVRDRWKATPPAKRVHKTADEAVEAARVGGLIPKK